MCPLVTLRDHEKRESSLLWLRRQVARPQPDSPTRAPRLDTTGHAPAWTGRDGSQAEAMPVPREAVGLYRQLLALNHSAYLLEHVRSVAFPGNVLVKNSRFGEAVAPLIN